MFLLLPCNGGNIQPISAETVKKGRVDPVSFSSALAKHGFIFENLSMEQSVS